MPDQTGECKKSGVQNSIDNKSVNSLCTLIESFKKYLPCWSPVILSDNQRVKGKKYLPLPLQGGLGRKNLFLFSCPSPSLSLDCVMIQVGALFLCKKNIYSRREQKDTSGWWSFCALTWACLSEITGKTWEKSQELSRFQSLKLPLWTDCSAL